MEDFLTKLMRSGYPARFRSQVVHGSLSAYQCRLRQDKEGLRPLYRPRNYNREERELAKLSKKDNWFRTGGEGVRPMAVLFVTATPNSELAKKVNNRLKEAKIPIRVAEKSGPKLSQQLMKTNPHQSDICSRSGCLVCSSRTDSTKGKSNCWKEGITYSLECCSCPEGKGVYLGETATTAFIRGREHTYQYKLHSEGKEGGKQSVMGRHVQEVHQGDHTVQWTMRVLSHHLAETHKRQCTEAVRIDLADPDSLINTRKERGPDLVSQASGAIRRVN